MQKRRTRGLVAYLWVTVMALMAAAISAQAQGRGGQGGAVAPVRVQVQFVQLKPDMVGAYRDLFMKEGIPAARKAGVPWLWTFTTGPIGQGFTGFHVQPLPNYAEFDKGNPLQRAMGADWLAGFNAKLRPTLVTTRRVIQTLNPDASIVSTAAAPPRLVLVQDIEPLPGKLGELLNLVASNYVPAFKKAGVSDFWVYGTNMGGPAVLTTVRPIANYAELDRPGLLQRAGMAQEAIQQLNARRNAISTLVETNVLAYQPDLSFGMPAPAK